MNLDFSSLLLQIPLVILIVYVIELRDKRWQEMMSERDTQWQRFFENQDRLHRETIKEFTIVLKEATEQGAQTHELMAIHDQRVTSEIPKKQEAIRGQEKGRS